MAASKRENRYFQQIPLPGLEEGQTGYRGPAVCEIVGVTYRQLDYWTTTELVKPSVRDADGSGSQRLYSFEDIVRLRIIKRLLDTGVSLQRIRKAIEYINDSGLDLKSVTLMSDGQRVYAMDDQREILDVLASGQGVFAIAVQPLYSEIEAQVLELESERAAPQVYRTGTSAEGHAQVS